MQGHRFDLDETRIAAKNFGMKEVAKWGNAPEEAGELGITDFSQYKWDKAAKMYVPTNGLTPDQNMAMLPLQKATAQYVRELDAYQEQIDSLRAASSEIGRASIEAIRQAGDAKRNLLSEANERTMQALQTVNAMFGTDRFSPLVATGLVSAQERANITKLIELDSSINKSIAEAQKANYDRDFELLDKTMNVLEKKQEVQTKLLEEQAKLALDNVKKMNEAIIRSSRDAAVGDLIRQGVTNPAELLNILNFAEDGTMIGDFTAKEIEDTLKALSPAGSIEKLSGSARDFFILKNMNQLPSGITSLPEDQQLFAYLRMEKAASTRATGGTGNTITWSEAKLRGLPLGLVGQSEEQIASDLLSAEPPQWFIEKISMENKDPKSLDPVPLWNEYRTKIMAEPDPSYRKPTATVIGQVNALKDKKASQDEINQFIRAKGFSPDDPAFK